MKVICTSFYIVHCLILPRTSEVLTSNGNLASMFLTLSKRKLDELFTLDPEQYCLSRHPMRRPFKHGLRASSGLKLVKQHVPRDMSVPQNPYVTPFSLTGGRTMVVFPTCEHLAILCLFAVTTTQTSIINRIHPISLLISCHGLRTSESTIHQSSYGFYHVQILMTLYYSGPCRSSALAGLLMANILPRLNQRNWPSTSSKSKTLKVPGLTPWHDESHSSFGPIDLVIWTLIRRSLTIKIFTLRETLTYSEVSCCDDRENNSFLAVTDFASLFLRKQLECPMPSLFPYIVAYLAFSMLLATPEKSDISDWCFDHNQCSERFCIWLLFLGLIAEVIEQSNALDANTKIKYMNIFDAQVDVVHYALSSMEFIYTIFLTNCFCHLDRVDFGFSLLGKIFKLGFQPTIITLNTLINGLCSEDAFDEAVELFDEMVAKGYQPDVYTYNVIVNGLCKIAKTNVAFGILKRMVEEDCEPDVVSYNAIIDSLCCNSGRWEEASMQLNEMLEANITPNLITFSILVDGLCKCGRVSKAHGIVKLMIQRGIKPDVVTYSSLIYGLCNSGRWEEASVQLNEMLEANITPNLITFSILVDGLCKEGRVAVPQLNGIIKLGIKPDVATYSSLMNGYCLLNKMDQAREIFDMMLSKGCTPDVVIYNILIDCYCRRKRIDEAMRLLDEMPRKGLIPNHVTYSSLIHGLCKAKSPQAAYKFFKDLCASGHSPGVVTYSILIDGFCKHRCPAVALSLFHEMQNNLLKPNITVYSTLIDGCSLMCIQGYLRHNDSSMATQLIDEMVGKGFSADATTTELVINLVMNKPDDPLVQKLLSCSKRSQDVNLK
ncbi:pentatricopeptide repeat-containing protein At1g62914, mitochondrial [Jatropha curcas]|uniref:pentatricopeptide repeat-containing protein At1g62914, mitochondrial n=1 Tax=Jatropha curcas TaxID=180498 RepID=UPI001895F10C|nr:pentatricopeptide repeat-containing protein At1g62914, mitochondrial [Jatropha curcas]